MHLRTFTSAHASVVMKRGLPDIRCVGTPAAAGELGGEAGDAVQGRQGRCALASMHGACVTEVAAAVHSCAHPKAPGLGEGRAKFVSRRACIQ